MIIASKPPATAQAGEDGVGSTSSRKFTDLCKMRPVNTWKVIWVQFSLILCITSSCAKSGAFCLQIPHFGINLTKLAKVPSALHLHCKSQAWKLQISHGSEKCLIWIFFCNNNLSASKKLMVLLDVSYPKRRTNDDRGEMLFFRGRLSLLVVPFYVIIHMKDTRKPVIKQGKH